MPGAGEAMGIPAVCARSLSALKAPADCVGDCLSVPSFPHRLYFVRHGETAYNAENRLQGQLDTPLNARGRGQARAIGGTLRSLLGREIDRLDEAEAFFASPLERARETTEIARDAMGLAPGRYRL
jgi:broad specificity phosphatase PhoE